MLHLTPAATAADRPRAAPAAPPILRYAAPAPGLSGIVTGHQVFVVPDGPARVERLLPGVANVRIAVDAGPLAVQIGRRRFDPVPDVALTGPTTHAPRASIGGGGALVAFGLTPLGWSRLVGRPAIDLADRIAPLEDVVGPDLPAALRRSLAAVDPLDAAAVARAVDAALLARLDGEGPDDAAIRAMSEALDDPATRSVADLAARTGVTSASLRRLSDEHFGMPPKLAIRRARFLRSFLTFFRRTDIKGYRGIDGAYHDVSHFLRDADRFLGMTPRRFASLATDFLDASIRARADALGAPACVVHPAGDGGSAA